MKIALLNVKFSPNLGDGVIAECIEYQLSKIIEQSEIVSIDIGGMNDYGSGGSIMGKNLGLMSKVRKLPSFIQKPIKAFLIPIAVTKKYSALWKEILISCDAIVIGGGHLFMDVDQYFPMRLLIATKQAHKNIPLAVYSVGVSKKMTWRGLRMFKDIFNHGRVVHLSVRDEQSKINWINHFKDSTPIISRDPGLLACETYGRGSFVDHKTRSQKVIAFGVSDPASMLPHSDSTEGVVCGDIGFYLESIKLLAPDYEIRMFTNGEDQAYLEKVADAIQTLPQSIKEKVSILIRALKPIELVTQITEADLVIAHRLHANIISFSHGIPHIGLGWDEKLKSFFSAIGRSEFIITSNQNAPQHIANLVKRGLSEGINPLSHQKVLDEAKQGIVLLAESFKQLASQ